jgi:hypothetical protein
MIEFAREIVSEGRSGSEAVECAGNRPYRARRDDPKDYQK